MNIEELALRRGIIESCKAMNASGINQGTSGNISARYGDSLLITPSGVPYEELAPEDIAAMPIQGEYGSWTGPMRPSSEWRFHLDIIRARPEVGAVVHAHSTYCTTLAICGRQIPALHYMIAAAGGPTVRGGILCHLWHQGAVGERAQGAGGAQLLPAGQSRHDRHGPESEARDVAGHRARDPGAAVLPEPGHRRPEVLPDSEIAHVMERFRDYGPRGKAAPAPEIAAGAIAGAATRAKTPAKDRQARK